MQLCASTSGSRESIRLLRVWVRVTRTKKILCQDANAAIAMDFSLRHSHASPHLFILCHARLPVCCWCCVFVRRFFSFSLTAYFSFDFIFAYKIYGLSGFWYLLVCYCFQRSSLLSALFLLCCCMQIRFFLFCRFNSTFFFSSPFNLPFFHCFKSKQNTNFFLSVSWLPFDFIRFIQNISFDSMPWNVEEKNAIEPKIYSSGLLLLYVLRFVIFFIKKISYVQFAIRNKKNVMHK